jgi:hypothetical protein
MSDARDVLEHALQRIVWELRPYLPDIVIIGGWAPYLHRQYGSISSWNSALSLTAEVDVLVTPDLPRNGRKGLAEILEGAGFTPTNASGSAAVWANDPERGEKVEFLVPHTGTIRNLNQVVPIRSQHRVGAISLSALEVMQLHNTVLAVPAVSSDGAQETVKVRVPSLGAYVLNKAATFNRRGAPTGGGPNPKRAKDLVYLRDLMAANTAVVRQIQDEVGAILLRDQAVQHLADIAANSVDGVVRSDDAVLREAARILAERDATSIEAGFADMKGHLLDLSEILLQFHSTNPAQAAEDD